MRYTPFDGSSKPFTIGLKPMEFSQWLEVDDALDAYLAEKDRLYGELPGKVFVERADTYEAQQEVLDLIVANLAKHHTATHRHDGDTMRLSGRDIVLEGEESPLRIASYLVQEDLVLMRKDHDGWRLVAASLCFPSSWSLTQKYDRALEDIHQPVPQFGRGTRMAELIARMFDKLQPANSVERMNWSLQGNDDLYHPLSHASRIDRADGKLREFSAEEIAARTFIRVERQTLRKLPASGDILFTIRIYLDPLARLAAHDDGAAVAERFSEQLLAMDRDQLAYKGLLQDRDRLVGALRAISRN
ncbi:heme-dependent oxidative N-demethylase family protein [Aliihoeflea sp. PC F10.4]